MRIRTIKPEFWTDEKIAELSIPSRLLFIALLNQADDEGNLLCSIKQIKVHTFPYDQIIGECEIIIYLKELISQELIIPYVTKNKSYLHITNFLKHQRINRPSPAQHPKFNEQSMSNHALFNEHSLGKEGRKECKVEERKGKEIEEEEEENISFKIIESLFREQNVEGANEFYLKMKALNWTTSTGKVKNHIAFTLAHIDNIKGNNNAKSKISIGKSQITGSTSNERGLTRAEQRKIAKQSTMRTE